MRTVRAVPTDGSPAGALVLADALARAVDGSGPAVVPTGPGDPAPDPALLAPVDDAVAVVVTTSGSTGDPKAVLLPAAALRASAAATHQRLGGPGRWLLALPAHHVAGVQVLLRSGAAGAPAAVLDLRAGFRPDAFAAAVDAADAMGDPVRHVSLVPTQLRRLLDDAGAGLDALRRFDAVLVGGAAADAVLLDRARAAGVGVITTYGMSETCGGCVYDGRPLAGVTVTLEAPDGGAGRVVLGGPTLAAGYRGPVTAEEAAAFTPAGFRTSDLGTLAADGRLEVLGRADDVVVSGGENVVPARVERALLAVDGVREACVVGLPDPEWGASVVAAVVLEPGAPDPESVRRAVAPALGRATPRRVVALDAIPLRGIGKPDRAAVRGLLARGGPLPAGSADARQRGGSDRA